MSLCTIAIPVYNRAQLVRQALESALAQDLDDLEILVVDNCSKDGTWETLHEYSDPRLRLVRNPSNVGLFGNLNRCVELAQGKYVRILCSDDRLIPGCIDHEICLMEAYPQASLLASRIFIVNEAGERIGMFGEHLSPGIYHGKEIITCALWVLTHYGHTLFGYPSGILMRREAVLKAGNFDTNLHQIGDVAYYLKLARHGDLIFTSQPGCEVMDHAGATTHQILQNGAFASEWYGLLQQWKEAIPSRRLYRQMVGQMAVYFLFLAQSHWRHKRPEAARAYWRASRQIRVSPFAYIVEGGRFLRIRVPLIRHNVRIKPLQPYQPLA